jgi:hypothetical protein
MDFILDQWTCFGVLIHSQYFYEQTCEEETQKNKISCFLTCRTHNPIRTHDHQGFFLLVPTFHFFVNLNLKTYKQFFERLS